MTIAPLSAVLFLVLGAALGAAYFTLMRRTVRLHAEGADAGVIAAHYALRIVVAVAVFYAVARAGALPLLLAFAGFLVARQAVLARYARRE